MRATCFPGKYADDLDPCDGQAGLLLLRCHSESHVGLFNGLRADPTEGSDQACGRDGMSSVGRVRTVGLRVDCPKMVIPGCATFCPTRTNDHTLAKGFSPV